MDDRDFPAGATRRTGRSAGWFLLALGVLIVLIGAFLAVGGGVLVIAGGSWYFALMGVAMVGAGVLIARRRPLGALVYWFAYLATIAWALWDVGLAFWPLVSRLFAFGVLALLVALVWPALRRHQGLAPMRAAALSLAALVFIALAATGVSAFSPKSVIAAQPLPPRPAATAAQSSEWRHWGNTNAGTRFAALAQIDRSNVDQLEVAWTFRTGDIAQSKGAGAEDQNTPLQIGNVLYVCTPYSKVIALDVDSGSELWRFDPKATAPSWQRCRGLGYHDGGATGAACAQRLFLPTTDARLIAIDARNGQPCRDFGTAGTVDLKTGMGPVNFGWYQQTSSPLVAGDLVVVGGRVADNFAVDEPPGVVRAYRAMTGELAWAWDPGNPEVTRLPPPGKTYTRGTPNVWSAMAFDEALGLVYLPTGNATPDFYAAQRTPLDEKYSSSLVALDVATGRVRWSFQATHHDIWDFDLPAQPLLYDVPDGRGGTLPALVQVTKQGEIFMLNRATGEAIARVEERPVPQGNVPGERYSPTQPYSVEMPSMGNETLVESDMWGATPLDQLLCRITFKRMRHQGVYTPPGLDASLQMPGSLGGMNWGSVSVDPARHYMFVNDMRLGLSNYMIPREQIPAGASGIEMGVVPQEGTPYGAMRQRFLSQLGIPCQKPPFGTLTAIDLRTRKIAWQVPVGTVQDTGPFGIKMLLRLPIGMPTLGPSLATQGGLVFFAGTQDYYLRAYDADTGRELWKGRLPVGSQAGPMTYVSPRTGRQYVIVNAGGARVSPDRGDYVIAYALPPRR
jgi:quinate dehydrogenase (quinone)